MNYDISDYVKRIWQWRWLLLGCPLLAVAITAWATMQQPKIYQTRTTLMVGQVLQKSAPTGNDFVAIRQLAESYAAMAQRQPILQATVERLQLPFNWQALGRQVYAAPIPGTQLLEILVEDTSPERAVAIADEIASQLIRQSPTAPDNQARQERAAFIQAQLDDLEEGITLAQERVISLKADLDTALSGREIQQLQNEINTLEGLVNSWQAKDGKSLTAANLGLIMAQANMNVIIVDADLRRPVLHTLFSTAQSPGLTEFLCTPELDLERCLHPTGAGALQLIPSGMLPPNPAELLGSQKMLDFIRQVETRADIVIFDSPPVLTVTDSSVLATRIKGTLLVARHGQTRLATLKSTLTRLDLAGVRLLGGVLNQAPQPDQFAGYYRLAGAEGRAPSRGVIESHRGKLI